MTERRPPAGRSAGVSPALEKNAGLRPADPSASLRAGLPARTPALQAIAYALLHLPLRFLYRVEVHERTFSRPLILAANHRSRFDPFLLAALPYSVFCQLAPIYFLTAEHYYSKLWLRPFLAILGAYPVPMRAWTMEDYFGSSLEKLRRGETILMFPEGRRVKSRGEAKPGAAYLSRTARVAVLPIRIDRRRIAIGAPMRVENAEEILDRIYSL